MTVVIFAAELEWLKEDLEEKKQEILVLKGEAAILENAKKRADDRVSILETSLEDARSEKIHEYVTRCRFVASRM